MIEFTLRISKRLVHKLVSWIVLKITCLIFGMFLVFLVIFGICWVSVFLIFGMFGDLLVIHGAYFGKKTLGPMGPFKYTYIYIYTKI